VDDEFREKLELDLVDFWHGALWENTARIFAAEIIERISNADSIQSPPPG
jgi:hypothetical protein